MSASLPGPRPPHETHFRRGQIRFVRAFGSDETGHYSVGTEIWSDKLAVVLSNDRMNSSSGFAQVVYISQSPARRPSSLHIPIVLYDGKAALAMCEQVHTVDASRLGRARQSVSAEEMRAIEAAVTWALGLHFPTANPEGTQKELAHA